MKVVPRRTVGPPSAPPSAPGSDDDEHIPEAQGEVVGGGDEEDYDEYETEAFEHPGTIPVLCGCAQVYLGTFLWGRHASCPRCGRALASLGVVETELKTRVHMKR